MMPELSLADALGAVGKPIHRVHTAGSVGASTAISGVTLVECGLYERVLVVCYEKQSDGNATWALVGRPLAAARARAARSLRGSATTSSAVQGARAHRLEGGGQGPPERAQEPVRAPAPAGHLDREGQGVPDAVGPAALPRVVPVLGRRGRDRARRAKTAAKKAPRRPPGSSRHAKRTEFGPVPRDATRCKPQAGVDCAKALYKKAGITNPLQADRLRRAVRAVLAGTSRCGSRAT